jgi:zinc/manganese transport system permease protein
MSVWQRIFDFSDYSALLPLVQNSLIAGLVLGVLCGLISTFVMMRDLPFAVHGISELSFAGASAALLGGVSVVLGSIGGSLVAAADIRVLFLSLYNGRSGNKFGLLLGQVVAVDTVHLGYIIWTAAIVIVALAVLWRPLTFASTDPEAAAARGVPVRLLSPVFMLLLGVTVAVSIPVVGALLILSIVSTPAAAAMRITAAPGLVPLLSVVFATVSTTGGILLSLGADGLPPTPYITTISFTIYAICRAAGAVRARRGWSRRRDVAITAPVPDLG